MKLGKLEIYSIKKDPYILVLDSFDSLIHFVDFKSMSITYQYGGKGQQVQYLRFNERTLTWQRDINRMFRHPISISASGGCGAGFTAKELTAGYKRYLDAQK